MNYLSVLDFRRGLRKLAPDTGGADGGTSGSSAENAQEPPVGETGAKESSESDPKKSFTQADIDRIIAREQAKWKRAQDRAVESARTEAERLAGMNAEERARHERETREAELSKREAEITRRELRAQALDTLTERGLPSELAQMLDYKDAEACNASLTAAEKAFRAAVQQGVEQRMRGSGAPRTGTVSAQAEMERKLRTAMGLGKK